MSLDSIVVGWQGDIFGWSREATAVLVHAYCSDPKRSLTEIAKTYFGKESPLGRFSPSFLEKKITALNGNRTVPKGMEWLVGKVQAFRATPALLPEGFQVEVKEIFNRLRASGLRRDVGVGDSFKGRFGGLSSPIGRSRGLGSQRRFTAPEKALILYGVYCDMDERSIYRTYFSGKPGGRAQASLEDIKKYIFNVQCGRLEGGVVGKLLKEKTLKDLKSEGGAFPEVLLDLALECSAEKGKPTPAQLMANRMVREQERKVGRGASSFSISNSRPVVQRRWEREFSRFCKIIFVLRHVFDLSEEKIAEEYFNGKKFPGFSLDFISGATSHYLKKMEREKEKGLSSSALDRELSDLTSQVVLFLKKYHLPVPERKEGGREESFISGVDGWLGGDAEIDKKVQALFSSPSTQSFLQEFGPGSAF